MKSTNIDKRFRGMERKGIPNLLDKIKLSRLNKV